MTLFEGEALGMTGYARLVVADYGPFRVAELELRPLTVIVGRNSTGKSFLAYTYVVLARALNPLNLIAFGGPKALEAMEEAAGSYVASALQRFLGKGLRELVRVGCEKAFAKLSIPSLGEVELEIRVEGEGAAHRVRLSPSKEVVQLAQLVKSVASLDAQSFAAQIKALAFELGLVEVLEAHYIPILLPDSRAGVLKTLSKLQPYAALIALRELDPDLELALHIATLSRALEGGGIDLEIAAPLLRELGVEEVKRVGSDVVVKLSTGVSHALSAAPSGVREALPIALTLAWGKSLDVVIEEPEAHLHPAAVRALARVVARAVNKGKRVLITTHSDALVASINNLVMLSSNPQKARALGYEDLDLLNPGKLGAYATKRVGSVVEVQKLDVDESGMDERELAEVLEELANERAEALA